MKLPKTILTKMQNVFYDESTGMNYAIDSDHGLLLQLQGYNAIVDTTSYRKTYSRLTDNQRIKSFKSLLSYERLNIETLDNFTITSDDLSSDETTKNFTSGEKLFATMKKFHKGVIQNRYYNILQWLMKNETQPAKVKFNALLNKGKAYSIQYVIQAEHFSALIVPLIKKLPPRKDHAELAPHEDFVWEAPKPKPKDDTLRPYKRSKDDNGNLIYKYDGNIGLCIMKNGQYYSVRHEATMLEVPKTGTNTLKEVRQVLELLLTSNINWTLDKDELVRTMNDSVNEYKELWWLIGSLLAENIVYSKTLKMLKKLGPKKTYDNIDQLWPKNNH